MDPAHARCMSKWWQGNKARMTAKASEVQYLIYGKTIIDTIRLNNGTLVPNMLGGGGTQGCFGAALWSHSVGFLSRSGFDRDPAHEANMRQMGVDLQGWVQYEDLPTLRGMMSYDEKEQLMASKERPRETVIMTHDLWKEMLGRAIPIPDAYQHPRAIHLITEYAHEPMVASARELKAKGAIFSLEPLIDHREWRNREEIIGLLAEVEIATPDFPSASGIAGSSDPLTVLKYWSRLGPELIAIRNGAEGSYIWSRDEDMFWHLPPVATTVVDPTGAGNSYGGGLVVGWSEHRSARHAAAYAGIAASYVVGVVGFPAITPTLRGEAHARVNETIATMRPMV